VAILRCERVADGDLDRALARIGQLTLARTPDGSFAEVADDERAMRLLAFAGVRTTVATMALTPRPGTRGALGRDLTPLPLGALGLDLVHVRALPLGAETMRLLRGRAWGRPSAARRALCRALLHGDDVALGWRRRAWSSPEVLRSREARAALRPVIFDATALGSPPEHRLLTRDRALARWLFG